MPRYFLHVRESAERIEDAEGSELPDLESARVAALEGARDINSEQVRSGEVLSLEAIEISDGDGQVPAVVPFRDAFRLA